MQHEAVVQLIGLGRIAEDRIPPAFSNPETAWSILHRGGVPWSDLAAQLSGDQLGLLIRGLIHYSRAAGPSALGGSVSPVIRLFSVFAERFPEQEPSLTRWIVENRVNPYEPFGTMKCNDASTLAAHLSQSAARRAGALDNERLESARQREAASRRAEIATSRLAGAVKRGDRDAVVALLAEGANPAKALDGASLVQWALANGRDAVAQLLREHDIP